MVTLPAASNIEPPKSQPPPIARTWGRTGCCTRGNGSIHQPCTRTDRQAMRASEPGLRSSAPRTGSPHPDTGIRLRRHILDLNRPIGTARSEFSSLMKKSHPRFDLDEIPIPFRTGGPDRHERRNSGLLANSTSRTGRPHATFLLT